MNDSALKEGRTLVVRSDITYTQENTSDPNVPTFVRMNDTVTQDPILDINRDKINQTYADDVQPEATETPIFADEIEMPEQPGPNNEGGVDTLEYTPDKSDPGDTDLAAVPSPDQPEPMQPVYGHRSRMLDLFHSGVPKLHRDTVENRGDNVLNISLREAMRTDGERTAAAINLELTQLMVMNVFEPVHAHRLPVDQRSRVIRSKMFLKQKLHPDGTPDKYKARLVAGGDQQDKEL
jgi:hypothetical protein